MNVPPPKRPLLPGPEAHLEAPWLLNGEIIAKRDVPWCHRPIMLPSLQHLEAKANVRLADLTVKESNFAGLLQLQV